jgi:hypothetical protein
MHEVRIRIEGQLDQSWAEWLDGFTFAYTEQDETILTGKVDDQAALYGLLAKLRDLGVKLIAVSFGGQDLAPRSSRTKSSARKDRDAPG